MTRINVCGAFGDQTELKGAARADERDLTEALPYPGDIFLELLHCVGPAAYDHKGVPLRMEGKRLCLSPLYPASPAAPLRVVQDIFRRRVDDPEHGAVLVNEGNVDRELPVPFDELLGPVQRIDEPEGFPISALFVRDVPSLFAQDGIEIVFLQERGQDLMGTAVCQRHGAFVAFLFDGERGAIHVHDGPAR
jgi:hypothetical protein